MSRRVTGGRSCAGIAEGAGGRVSSVGRKARCGSPDGQLRASHNMKKTESPAVHRAHVAFGRLPTEAFDGEKG